jgi:hypothetical protein
MPEGRQSLAVKLIHMNVYNAKPQSVLQELRKPVLVLFESHEWEAIMGFGRGALLWLLGVPLPIIILLALFWHH